MFALHNLTFYWHILWSNFKRITRIHVKKEYKQPFLYVKDVKHLTHGQNLAHRAAPSSLLGCRQARDVVVARGEGMACRRIQGLWSPWTWLSTATWPIASAATSGCLLYYLSCQPHHCCHPTAANSWPDLTQNLGQVSYLCCKCTFPSASHHKFLLSLSTDWGQCCEFSCRIWANHFISYPPPLKSTCSESYFKINLIFMKMNSNCRTI